MRRKTCYVYYRMCSLTIACVLLLKNVFSYRTTRRRMRRKTCYAYYRMCSLTVECVLLLQNVFSYYRMCSLTIECVLLQDDKEEDEKEDMLCLL